MTGISHGNWQEDYMVRELVFRTKSRLLSATSTTEDPLFDWSLLRVKNRLAWADYYQRLYAKMDAKSDAGKKAERFAEQYAKAKAESEAKKPSKYTIFTRSKSDSGYETEDDLDDFRP